MFRLIIALIIVAFAISSDATDCDWHGIEIDQYGCVNFNVYNRAVKLECSNMPDCFKFQVQEVQKPEISKKEPKKEYFKSEPVEEKKKIMPILDSSAVALLKNSKLKDIKIIFYNKTGKLSKDFQKDAEKYLLDKGVKRDQFKIEIR